MNEDESQPFREWQARFTIADTVKEGEVSDRVVDEIFGESKVYRTRPSPGDYDLRSRSEEKLYNDGDI